MKVTIDLDAKLLGAAAEQIQKRMQDVIIRNLCIIGEKCIKVARDLGEEYRNLPAQALEELRHRPHQPNYIDDTGNLRQSIGYLVALDGKVVKQDLPHQEGERLAYNVLSKYQHGYALIMVAGMSYAEEVTHRGYDVLDSAAIDARRLTMDFINNSLK